MDNNDDCNIEPTETYAYGVYGPLESFSRVGDEYQTKIPQIISNSEYRNYIKNPFTEDEEMKKGAPIDFLIGLNIPIVWINQVKMEDNVDSKSDFLSNTMNIKSDNVLVPGCVLEPWSEMEKGSFVLGLYIFKKDFVRLKRFMESKKLGDVMSYYYGDFYKSDEYKRWSECRKSRGKRCILGHRIFSGLRQQEFLCRLVPYVSQECQNSLLEISRTFGDSRISLDQYVFSIKSLIGMKLFIDALAIGKGKQDLTGNAIEPTKENQAIHIRPEIPTGKACSSLSSKEIIQFLTGDYRLSKARSNDLFWEAVWPRLLARGWHSEQPNAYNYAANAKNSLVFLMPGVKKFSRRLVKGDAYLDSVTDVLNKVAGDPQLLELDNEQNGASDIKMEEHEEDEEEEDENGFVEKPKGHCYLQPKTPNLNMRNVLMKFTVVDTSLRGGKIFRVRELDTMKLSLRSGSDESHSELVSSDDSDDGNLFIVDQETNFNRQKGSKKQKTSNERKNLEKIRVKTVNSSDSVIMKAKSSRKSNQENLGQHAKRRRRLTAITACSRVDSKAGSSLDSHVGSSYQANNNNNNNNHKLSSNLSFTSRCSSIDTVEEQNQPQSINLIDLNYPQVTPEFENDEFVTQVKEERIESVPQKQSENNVVPKEQENGGLRRQSTRNRPPTARALEALANGFLTVNTRKRGKEESKSRNSRNTLGEIGFISECSTGDASSAVKGDDENGEIEK